MTFVCDDEEKLVRPAAIIELPAFRNSQIFLRYVETQGKEDISVTVMLEAARLRRLLKFAECDSRLARKLFTEAELMDVALVARMMALPQALFELFVVVAAP